MSIPLEELTAAAKKLIEAEKATEDAENALKVAKEKERVMREETLPGMMQEIGVEKMTLLDGNEITVKQEVYASVPAHAKERAWAWLETNGYGGLIKTEVAVEFGKGALEEAHELIDKLASIGVTNATLSRDVHAQTLKAFLKERLANPKIADDYTPEEIEAGQTPLSLEMFGARPVMTAKVKQKK